METNPVSRRNFLKLSGLTASAFALGIYTPLNAAQNEDIILTLDALDKGIALNAYMYIDTSGKVTLVNHKAEMGQGVHHALAQIMAEELEVNLQEVQVVFGEGNPEKYGSQVTGGSFTVRSNYKKLMQLGATAREMLLEAAAQKWNVSKADCYAEGGHVLHKTSGKKGHYGEFVEIAATLTPPKEVKVKTKDQYKLIRKSIKRLDLPDKVTGKTVFGLDKRVEGMMYAAVERNPRFMGKVKSFDASAALKIAGVQKVFKIRTGVQKLYREGVVVVATNTWAAFKGKKALKIEWDDTGFEHLDSATIFSRQKQGLEQNEGMVFRKNGDPTDILAKTDKKLEAFYETPYQSHSPMEPVNAIAHFQGDKVALWGPFQAPDWVQDYVANKMGLAKKNVTVNMTFLGGGFGRKAMTDFAHEAAVISKEAGVPIQVVWTREDDMTQGPFRPAVSYRCEGAVADGEISALKFRITGQNFDHIREGDAFKEAKSKPNRNTAEGFLNAYTKTLKNFSIADVPFDAPIITSFWRSVYASTHSFAYESFLDEMAVDAKIDPLQFRKTHLKDERLHRLMEKMEAVSAWKNRGKGYGVAITECFGSTCGHVVKVSKNAQGSIKIDNVWAVLDCGWYVHPDTIKAQVEGSILMALGAATQHAITFKAGMAEQHNFHEYLMPRITDMPQVAVHIMENDADAGGVGEPGLPPFAPALANAIFDLTGKRIRKMPFSLEEI